MGSPTVPVLAARFTPRGSCTAHRVVSPRPVLICLGLDYTLPLDWLLLTRMGAGMRFYARLQNLAYLCLEVRIA